MKKNILLVPLLFLCVLTGFAQTPIFNQVPPICSGSEIGSLPKVSTNGISGTWSPPVVNNTTTTTYTFTPDAGQSASVTTMTITVNPIVTPEFNLVAPICLGSTISPLPTTSNNGITGTWSPALNNTLSNYYKFFPNEGECATTARLGIAVNTADTSFSGLNDSYCVNDSPVTLTPNTPGGTFSGPGINGNTFNPSIAGAGTVNITYNLPNYNYSGIPYSPLTTVGTNVSLGDDEVSPGLPIGFNFNFFGNQYSQFYISSNGFISFDSNVFEGCCSGRLLPSADLINNLIAACWDDLDPTAGGTITYYTTGISPNRKLVVSYNNINHRNTTSSVNTQIVLYETTNIIEIYNANVSGNYERTEGLENAYGTFGVAVPGRNGSIWSAANDGIRFTPTVISQCPKMTKTVTVKQLIIPTFTQVEPIYAGDTIVPLKTKSNNDITGTWELTADYDTSLVYTFTPTTTGCFNTATMTVTVNPYLNPSKREVNTSFKDQMNTIFGNLDKDKVPHDILLDYGMEFTEVPAFNGTLTDSTYSEMISMSQIYKTLLTSRIRDVSSNGFVMPTEYVTRWHSNRSSEYIAIGGLYFKYSRIAKNALSTNKITYINGVVDDKFINGVWQNPYEELQTFVMTPAIKEYEGLDLAIRVPSAIFYSNYKNLIQSIQIDFGNNSGYVTVPYDQTIPIRYATDGVKIWKYKLNFANGTSLLSHSRIMIRPGTTTGILPQ